MPDSPPNRDGFLQTHYREITLSAVIFAIVIGVVMNAAITYAGLKIGFTIGGSAIAAVLGFGVLRGILRKGSILETNVAQTIASAVNTSNSGVIFTVPVLFLLGYQLKGGSVDFWLITLGCVAGAYLGAAFIIPLRKQMLDIERLRFPSPTAVASILKSPGAGAAKAVVLVIGILVGAAIFLPTQIETLTGAFGAEGWGLQYTPLIGAGLDSGLQVLGNETFDLGRLLGIPVQVEVIFAIAPFALGAGYLTGRAGLFVLAGGVLAYWVLNPLAYELGWMPGVEAEAAAGYGYSAFNKPLGIGLLLGGALMGVLFALPAIKEALKSIAAAGKVVGGRDELSLKPVAAVIILGGLILFAAAYVMGNRPINTVDPVTQTALATVESTETISVNGYTLAFESAASVEAWNALDDDVRDAKLDAINANPGLLASMSPVVRTIIITLIGLVWIWFAGIIIAQCAGMTDWSPISGLALLTVVLVMFLAGTGAVVGAVLIGAALCVAITLAADMMGDLKTGYLVGAQPRRQQIAELIVVGIGPVVCMLTILLIASANMQEFGVAMGEGTPTRAPQALALQSVITGVQGGDMPYWLYGFGLLLGALLGIGSFPGLGVLVGLSMYLPFIYISTYGLGCLVQMGVAKVKGQAWAEDWGVPFCAGLIVGESVLALLINGLLVVMG